MFAPRSLALAALPLAAPLAFAHHSPAAYDLGSQVTVAGTVTKLEWANPHAYLTVEEANGERTWLVELVSPSVLKQFGWSPSTLAVGDAVTFTGMPGRNRSRNIAYLQLLEKSNAIVLDLRSVGPGRPAPGGPPPSAPAPASGPAFGATSVAGIWATLPGPSIGQLLGNAAALPVTARGAAAMRDFTDTANPGRDCVQFSAPLYMVLPFFRSIEVGADAVVIRGEEGAVVRTVDLRRNTHDGAVRSLQGDSIGRFEGTTLVVDTTHFAEHRLGNAAGLPSGAAKHLVERFELAPGGGALNYTFTLDDPDYLASTVRGVSTWAYRPDVEYAPLSCGLDNARRFLDD